MSKYTKPALECVSFKLEEKIASACTGCCVDSGWYKEWTSPTEFKEFYLVAQNNSVGGQ